MNTKIASLEAQEDEIYELYRQSQNVTEHLKAKWQKISNEVAKLKHEERQKQCAALNEQES